MKSGHQELTVSVSEFKAKCLEIFSRLDSRSISRVTVTRHGRPVADVFPPRSVEGDAHALFEGMRGTVVVPGEVDLTEPVIDMSAWDEDPLERTA